MKFILVGKSNGRRKIRWGTALLLSCGLGIVSSLCATAFYFWLTGTWSVPAAMITFIGPFLTVGSGIQSALQLPIEQLTPLDGSGV